ncbi:hypothetical protein WJ30_11665 [Burkholderia diffusa]|nr:hypothetical protein WJ30_11665 [Burkholderia diffusa]
MHQRMINLYDLVPRIDYSNAYISLVEEVLILLVETTNFEQDITPERTIRSDQCAEFERMRKTVEIRWIMLLLRPRAAVSVTNNIGSLVVDTGLVENMTAYCPNIVACVSRK